MFPGFVRLATAATAAVIVLAASAHAQEMAPDALVKTVTLEVVDLIQKDKDIQKGDRKKLIVLIEAKVLPHFNFQAMTSSAVGRNWDKASAEQKARLTDEFRTLLVRTSPARSPPTAARNSISAPCAPSRPTPTSR